MVLVKNSKIIFIVLVIFIVAAGSASGCNKLKTKKAPLKSSKTKAIANQSSITPQREITTSEAIAAVKRFTTLKKIKSTTRVKPDRLEIIGSGDYQFYVVNVKKGIIKRLGGELKAEPVNPKELPLSLADAEKRARNFITKFDNLKNSMLTPPTESETGGNLTIYSPNYLPTPIKQDKKTSKQKVLDNMQFQWRQFKADRPKQFYNYSVEVDLKTGKLYNYDYFIQKTAISVIPRISKKQADATVTELLKKWIPISKNSPRKIVYGFLETKSVSDINRDRLVWTILFTELSANQGKPVNNFVEVDALKGNITYDPHPAYTSKSDIATAIMIFKRFAKVKNIKSIDRNEKSETIEVKGSDNKTYRFNYKTGIVQGLSGNLNSEPVDTRKLPLTKAEAEKRAREFIEQIYLDFKHLTPGYTFEPQNQYEIHMIIMDKNNAILPGEIRVTIDPKTGRLHDYKYYLHKINISTKPRISKQNTLKIARKLLNNGTQTIKITGCQLFVIFNGMEQLHWKVYYDSIAKKPDGNIARRNMIPIDALTGKEVKSFPHMSF